MSTIPNELKEIIEGDQELEQLNEKLKDLDRQLTSVMAEIVILEQQSAAMCPQIEDKIRLSKAALNKPFPELKEVREFAEDAKRLHQQRLDVLEVIDEKIKAAAGFRREFKELLEFATKRLAELSAKKLILKARIQ